MPGRITKGWTPEDITLLLSLADKGATLFRASAALGRRMTSVRKKAHQLGKSFPGVRKIHANMREATASAMRDS